MPGAEIFLPDLLSCSPDVIIKDLNYDPSLINSKEILPLVSNDPADEPLKFTININDSSVFQNVVSDSTVVHTLSLNTDNSDKYVANNDMCDRGR